MITEDDSTALAAEARSESDAPPNKKKKPSAHSGLYRAVWRWHFYAGHPREQGQRTLCRLGRRSGTILGGLLLVAGLLGLGLPFGAPAALARADSKDPHSKARLDAVKAKAALLPKRTVWEFAGEKDPYPAGGAGSPNAVMTAAGLTNVFGDIPKDYEQASWEEVAKRNPQLVWIQSSAGLGFVQEADKIKAQLQADPRLANVAAIKNKAYVLVSYQHGGVESPLMLDGIGPLFDRSLGPPEARSL